MLSAQTDLEGWQRRAVQAAAAGEDYAREMGTPRAVLSSHEILRLYYPRLKRSWIVPRLLVGLVRMATKTNQKRKQRCKQPWKT